jgi:23S rRNA pseudouridine955/2504/2580 synthase
MSPNPTNAVAPDPDDRSRRRALPESASGGQAARTLITAIADASRADQPATRLRATLETGRTHQIRVHLSHEGHGIVGDDKYGDFVLNKALARGGEGTVLSCVCVGVTIPVTLGKV